ncbi:MAG: riboflavin synthase subunit alpha [Candidatus Poseidoniaceae archaeon]|jgi:riboflavin synthase|nr:riboflavin synthase subunit alpha [Candidatus Poseidoniaceae archaeon]
MFTGIVAGMGQIVKIEGDEVVRLTIDFGMVSTEGLVSGASVSVDGVCLTVVDINESLISFDVIPETLIVTTLSEKIEGMWVNLERALQIGDELGGHLLSGHIIGIGEIIVRDEGNQNISIIVECSPDIMKFIQPKGYVAIDGISLTVGHVEGEMGFSLHLIPETLRLTTISGKQPGDHVNIEVDSMTQMVVATVERILEERQ